MKPLPPQLISIIVWFEGPSLGQAHVLGLLLGQLSQMSLKSRNVQRRYELVHQLGHEIHVGFVPATGGIEQFYECQGLRYVKNQA